MEMPRRPICSLLLFLATSVEAEALKEAASESEVLFKKDVALTQHFRNQQLWYSGIFATVSPVLFMRLSGAVHGSIPVKSRTACHLGVSRLTISSLRPQQPNRL